MDYWKRYEWETKYKLNLWQYWISATVESDENVKRDKTIEFVALLSMWNCWMRLDCEIR